MIVRYDGQQLTDGGREGLSGLSVTQQRSVQVSPILRAAAAKTFGRGNRVYTISFSFAREYSALIFSHDAISEFLESLPETGDLELEETGPSASVQSTIYEGACFQSGGGAQIGKTIIFTLTFIAHSRKVTPP